MSNSSSTLSTVFGYPVLYNVPYDMGNHWEQIAPGCFDKSDMSEIRLLRDHNPSLLLARIGTATMTVKTDSKGLFFRSTMPNTELGQETAKLLQSGVLTQLSWGWSGTVDRWSTYQGRQLRIITAVRTVWDISLVTYPANPATLVQLEAPIFTTTTTTTSRATNQTTTPKPVFDPLEENYLFQKMILEATPEAGKAYQDYNRLFSSTNN